MKKQKAKESKTAQFDVLFSRIVGNTVTVAWSKHVFENMLLQEIRIATQKDLYNVPEKRLAENGKMVTPRVLQIVFSGGETLNFVINSIKECVITSYGVKIIVGDTEVRFLCTS